MTRGPIVTVAGAGALGLTAALALAEAGCAVTVRDPGRTPSASAVAAGMLAPAFEAALDAATADHLDLLMAARNLWPALAKHLGIELDRSGTAAVGTSAWLTGIRSRLDQLGLHGQDLRRTALDELAPGVAHGLEAVLVREDWRLEPRPALQALRRAAEAAGARLITEPAATRGDADWLVIATGAGRDLAQSAPELDRLSPIKGQILRFLDRRGGGLSLRGEGVYAVPSAEGLAIGATMEVGRDDNLVDPVTLKPLTEAAVRLLPALEGATFDASAGVRAATPDGLPMVGRSESPGVILAVGARRNGWLLAPLVAQIVTACVMGHDSDPYGPRLDPVRFGPGRAR